jgi:protein associated with RNAse G/E
MTTNKEKFTPYCDCVIRNSGARIMCPLCKSAPMMYEALEYIAHHMAKDRSRDGVNVNKTLRHIKEMAKEALKLAEGK